MKNILLILTILLITISCNQKLDRKIDETNSAIKTLTESVQIIQEKNIDHRYKIVQSTLAAKGTYKLDSYTGDIFQMVVDQNGNNKWDLLRRIGNSENDTKIEGTNNYEVFLSTLAIRFTYLINVNTGATWQLVQDPDTEEIFFSSFE